MARCHTILTHVIVAWKMDQRVTIGETFLALKLDKSVRILDVACGAGAVAQELVQRGYTNIDGLDSMKGYLEVAQEKKLYNNNGSTKIYRTPSPLQYLQSKK